MELLVRVVLPTYMIEVQMLHSISLTAATNEMSEDHFQIGACIQTMKDRELSQESSVPSTASIKLPLKVEPDLSYEALNYPPSTTSSMPTLRQLRIISAVQQSASLASCFLRPYLIVISALRIL